MGLHTQTHIQTHKHTYTPWASPAPRKWGRDTLRIFFGGAEACKITGFIHLQAPAKYFEKG